jgi:hypothetical protein
VWLRPHRDALSSRRQRSSDRAPRQATRDRLGRARAPLEVLRHGTATPHGFGGERVRNGAPPSDGPSGETRAASARSGGGGGRIPGRSEGTLKRNEAQEGEGRLPTGNGGGRHQTRRRSKASKPTLPILPLRQSCDRKREQARRSGDRAGNGKGATDAVTRSGCRRGFLRGVRTCIAGKRRKVAVLRLGRQKPKRGGPQDRQRDATSPRLVERRKPSRW